MKNRLGWDMNSTPAKHATGVLWLLLASTNSSPRQRDSPVLLESISSAAETVLLSAY